jgi:hypothetical protein
MVGDFPLSSLSLNLIGEMSVVINFSGIFDGIPFYLILYKIYHVYNVYRLFDLNEGHFYLIVLII